MLFVRYVKSFKRYRQELTEKLFKIYNDEVFENKVLFFSFDYFLQVLFRIILTTLLTNRLYLFFQIPATTELRWNNRLAKTAGLTYNKIRYSTKHSSRRSTSAPPAQQTPEARNQLRLQLLGALSSSRVGQANSNSPSSPAGGATAGDREECDSVRVLDDSSVQLADGRTLNIRERFCIIELSGKVLDSTGMVLE